MCALVLAFGTRERESITEVYRSCSRSRVSRSHIIILYYVFGKILSRRFGIIGSVLIFLLQRLYDLH